MSEPQGQVPSRREAAPERSGERKRGPMYKNRIRGRRGRTSRPPTAKSISTKDHVCTSGGRARKDVVLTPGDLRRVLGRRRAMTPRTKEVGSRMTAAQKSAEGVVGEGNEPGHLGRPTRVKRTGSLTRPKARTVPFPEGRVNGAARRTGTS